MNDLRQAAEMALEALLAYRSFEEYKPTYASEAIEALRQALDQLPDTTKMIDKVCIRYWVQDTTTRCRCTHFAAVVVD